MAETGPNYVLRRFLAVLILVGVVAAVVFLLVRPWRADSGAPVKPVTAAKAGEDVASEAGAGELLPCGAGELRVVAITDRGEYEAGQNPMLSLSVENTGKKECTVNLGTDALLFEITSGSDLVWRSSDCQVHPQARPLILKAGERLVTEELVWDRTRSTPESCELARPGVAAGAASYHLHVSAAGVRAQTTKQFLLY